MSSRVREGRPEPATKPSPGAGFFLADVLVALVLAGLLFGAMGRAFSMAWSATRAPFETMSGITVAGLAAAGSEAEAHGRQLGHFSYSRSIGPVTLAARPTRLAPAPLASMSASGTPEEPAPNASAAEAPAGPPLRLRRILVLVRAPSGRRMSLETIRRDATTD